MVQWVVGSILNGGNGKEMFYFTHFDGEPIEIFLIPASAP